MRYSELTNSEVVNIRTCRKLGYVCDLCFDCHSGQIQQLIVPGPCKFLGVFPGSSEYCINYSQIRQMGPDIILVDICEEEALHDHRGGLLC
ncbi:MAG: YlmC/YmxH family sporulation protein [Lachnospiraceae bacterium]|nr:YlmC/YmxH family sporulation protein [Lachnospiraceae bacterium]